MRKEISSRQDRVDYATRRIGKDRAQILGLAFSFDAFFSPCDFATGMYPALRTRPSQTGTGEPASSVNPLPRSEIQRESSPAR